MTYKEFASQINIKVDNPPNDCDMSREIMIEDCICLFNSLGRQIRYLQERSNWHKGTPTEEGWYVLECGNSEHTYYTTDYWSNKVNYWTVNRVIRWQKIEPYKE